MDRDTKDLLEAVNFIKDHMATKDDIAEVKSTLAEHTRTLAEHTKTLDDHSKMLNDHTRDLSIIKNDVATSLDKRLQLEVRVSAVEKHLGLGNKIAA